MPLKRSLKWRMALAAGSRMVCRRTAAVERAVDSPDHGWKNWRQMTRLR
ncbi:hypothetical protein KCP74_04905 [Salmonella enterica subsp. enterica]|nr:hypothetical protein KCP74_04905 [Salmonella enterica subsp. enterica]